MIFKGSFELTYCGWGYGFGPEAYGVVNFLWTLTISAAELGSPFLSPYIAIFLDKIPMAPSTIPKYLTL